MSSNYNVLGEYEDFEANEVLWDAMLQSIYFEENDEPQDKFIYILELENADLLNDLSDEDVLSENMAVIKKCSLNHLDELNKFLGEEETNKLKKDIKDIETTEDFQFIGYLYCQNKYCTSVVQPL